MTETKTDPKSRIQRLVPEADGGAELASITQAALREMGRLKARASQAADERSKLRSRLEELDDVLDGLEAKAGRLAADRDARVAEQLAKLGIHAPLPEVSIEMPDAKRPNDLVVSYPAPLAPDIPKE